MAGRTNDRDATGVDALLTIKQAAALLHVSEQTLRRWDARGRLRAVRHPVNHYRLYARADLLALRPGPPARSGGDATGLIGRVTELASLHARFEAGARLVTVVGPPGIGKTRLARAWLSRSQTGCFIDCATTRSDETLCSAAARALDVAADVRFGSDPHGCLGAALARHDRVVLDNVEQVLDAAAALISRWRTLAPRTELLVTSRERLRLADEQVFEPGALDAATDGVALLIARATACGGEAAVHGVSRDVLEAIVTRLDGIPLAIELAAARLPVLGARELLARLDQRFDVLAQGARDGDPRQATLEHAIDWSWDLLDPDERRTWAACTVFRAGFTLQAAEAVVPTRLATLVSLCEKSLLQVTGDPHGGRRFTLLESLHAYASRRTEAFDREAVRARHARWYLERGREGARAVAVNASADSLARMDAEREDLVCVATTADDPRDRADATLSLHALLILRGPYDEDARRLETALALGGLDDATRARLYAARAATYRYVGDTDASLKASSRALASARATGDATIEGQVLAGLAIALRHLGRLDEAEARAHEARALHTASGDARSGRITRLSLALIALERGRMDELAEHALAVSDDSRDAADGWTGAIAQGCLGRVHDAAGRDDEARRCFDDAVDAMAHLGDAANEATLVTWRAMHDHARGRVQAARSGYEHALARIAGRRAGGPFEPWIRGLLATARAELGDGRAADEQMEQAAALARRRGSTASQRALTVQRAHVALARGGTRADVARDDDEGDALRTALRLLARCERVRVAEAAREAGARALRVAAEASGFVPPGGAYVDLSTRPTLARLLAALRAVHPRGEALGVEALFEAAWPGERARAESRAQRVRSAVASLRRIGLRDVLQTREGAYRLDPRVAIVRLDVPPGP